MSRNYAKPERANQRVKRLALIQARAQGCVCKPDVTVLGIKGEAATTMVAHDSWCPLTRSREGAGAMTWDFATFPKGSISGGAI